MSFDLTRQKLERLPAFMRMGSRGKQRLHLVSQATTSDCGPACLAMVLGYHGRYVPLETVRTAMGGAAQGVSGRQIAEAARRLGLRARGVKIEIDKLRFLPPGSILHWDMNHFVVFERLDQRGARILDPSSGPRNVSFRDLEERCTGVALVFEPTAQFTPAARGRSPRVARYLRWLGAAPGYWPRVIALSAVLQLTALGVPAAIGLCVDKVVPRHDLQLLQLLATGALVLLSVQFLSSYVRATLLLHLRTYMDAQMTLDLNDHLLHLPFAFFQQRSAGDLVMRLSSSAQIRELLTSAVLSVVLDGSMATVYFVVLLLLAAPLAAIALGIAFLQTLLVLLTGRRNAELMAEQLVTQARLSSAQVEALAAIEPIKSMGAEERIGERWANLYADVLNTTLDRGKLNNQVGTLTAALGFAGPVALLLCGAVMTLNGSLEIGAMLALSSVGAAFLTPVGALASMWTQLQTLRSYLERLEDLLDTPTERRSEAAQSGPPLQGRIELRDVSFAYSPVGPNVVDRVNLRIEPGEFVAIWVRPESGKSTLARLLGGMHAASSGSLSFEGIDAKAWDPGELRGTLGIVTQDPRLLAATVRDNISLFDTSTPLLRVQEAARLAEIHDDIARLPLGYDTVLSDGGGSLSGGQRQRLALARALLREPTVVVLDEATSALDTMTERVLHQRLAAMCCTRIVIAHRMTTIRDANRIVVLEAGRVVDIGRHSELLARCRLYRELTGMPTSERTLTPLLDLG